MSSKVGVIVPTYDGYADIWPIASELFKRFWPDREWPMYWMTNGHPVPDIAKAIVRPRIERVEWGNNIAAAIESMDEDLILFWVEEIFLLSPVPCDLFHEAADLLKSNSDVGAVQLTRYYIQPCTPTIGSFTDYPRDAQGFSSALPAIFRKEILMHLLRRLPMSNEFEQQSARVMSLDFPRMRSLISCKPMFCFCDNALQAGPWRQCAVKHLNDGGFSGIDFSLRGISPDSCRFMDGVPLI